MSTTAMIVSRQSSRSIATSAEITVTTLPRMLVTVLVSTPETPPTSFCRRDWMTPVFVRVKKPSSIACRWSKSFTRRSPVTALPTVAVNHVWVTPSAADSRNRPTMMPTSRHSRPRSGADPSTGKSASSKMRCTINGGMTAIAAPTMTRMPVIRIRPRYGRNSAIARRPRCGIFGASALSLRCAAASIPLPGPGPRPPIPPPWPPILMRSL